MRKLTFGFSPCPNDTFAFHALVHGLVDAPFPVRPLLLDIEELNHAAPTTAPSTSPSSASAPSPAVGGALPAAAQRRCARTRLRAAGGGARARSRSAAACAGRIAIPGRETTAYLLLRLAAPQLAGCRRAALRPDPSARSTRRGGRLPDHPREPLHLRRPRPVQGRRPRRLVGGRDRRCRCRWPASAPAPISTTACSPPPSGAVRDVGAVRLRSPRGQPRYVRAHSQEMSDAVCDPHIRLYVNALTLDFGH